ncbi:ATP synthase-coupling factor 6, mitochondrial [Culicoides brevitarsis]|uniref:ATP synthase-coupling factor 6, mitochondrial n=1 Tax=Culicoides brevitarsis TaxID=469753 RepID=UPI00307C930E
MLTSQLFAGARTLGLVARRNIGIAAPAMQKVSDPIQQLFLDKIKEYKAKSAGGKLVDPSPETEKELKNELERIAKTYGGTGKEDMTKFPEFKFEEPKLDPINQTQ